MGKTATEKHIEGLEAYKEHSAHGTGCIMRCTSGYESGKAHSHRWNAAQRARGEGRIPYNRYELYQRTQIYRSKERLEEIGATDIAQDVGKRYGGKVEPFTTMDSPFCHNAHHIIPVGTLMKCILAAAGGAKPNAVRMENLIVSGMLGEPYNVNDQPNMIVLPTEPDPADILGLPIHLEGSRDHPVYSTKIKRFVNSTFNAKYKSLASQVAAESHDETKEHTAPAIRSDLETISNTMYEAIIALAMTRSRVGESLDSVSHALACRYARAVSK